jgi:DNA mismatch repair protein MutS
MWKSKAMLHLQSFNFVPIRMNKEKTAETPLMQQHKAIKAKYPDAILLFRVGDFYETFGQDAIIAAQVLGITLTKRNNGAPAHRCRSWPAFRIMH